MKQGSNFVPLETAKFGNKQFFPILEVDEK